MTQITVSNLAWKRIANDTESALSQVLQTAIPKKIPSLSRDALVDLKIGIWGYTMHVNSYVEMKRLIKYWDLDSRDANAILHATLESYEANLGLRQTTLICLNGMKEKSKINYGKMLTQCDMNPANEILLRSLPEINFGARSLLGRVKEKPLLMPSVIRQNCEKTMRDIKPFISGLVYRKLHFIVKHNNYRHEDLIADLERKGVETYYRVTPFVTDLHRENSVKNSIHNQGMKEISFYTSKKRARIEKTGEGEYSTKIDSIVTLDDRVDDNVMTDSGWQAPSLDFELTRFVEQYNKENKSRAKIVSKLLCSDDDEMFIQFVRTRLRLNENCSMETVNLKKPRVYVALIAEYHGIPELTVRRIAYEVLQGFNGNQS